jgi:serine/threonine-protein kinase
MLASGTKVGPYEIQGLLGTGGMGEVYRAKDTRLDRIVAIKALPEKLASNEERLARFNREARVLAALHHHHIATIHGVEESNGSVFLILELAEGETLSERLVRGPFPLEEALMVALQIAEALEAAHEKGIVHRDLKPANVKIDAAGQIKLLDFGLAKAWIDVSDNAAGDLSQSPTATHMATADGIILGTAAYMSPEQARGKQVDRRTDIWAFGVLLFEMLTGRRLFDGETVSDILAGILKSDLNLGALPAETPESIRTLIGRCLERDPRRRLQDIGEARIAIEDYLANPQKRSRIPTPEAKQVPILPWALACLFLLLLVGGAIWYFLHPRQVTAPAGELTAFAVSLSPGESLMPDEAPIIGLSPDGKTLAYSRRKDKTRQLFVRRMDQIEPTAVPGAENAVNPFFSPDGRWIAFFADGKLQKIPVSGGTAVILANATSPRGGCWMPDDRIVFSPSFDSGLLIMPASGGSPQPLTVPDASKKERTHRWPEALPNGKGVLFSIGWLDSPSNYDNNDIAVVSVDTKKIKTLIHNSRMARYMSPGFILFQRVTTLFAARFDPQTFTLTSPEVQVQERVAGETSCGAGYFSVTQNGTLASVPTSSVTNDSKLVILDRSGNGAPLPLPLRSYNTPRFSPDGKQLAFSIGDLNGANSDIWTYDLTSGALNRLTFDTHSAMPLWSSDGKKIVYTATSGKSEGLNWKPADGSGEEQHLITNPTGPSGAGAWSTDGNILLYTVTGKADDIALLDMRVLQNPNPSLLRIM